MHHFKYTALTLEGKKISGTEECADQDSLRILLESKGLLLLSNKHVAAKSEKANRQASPAVGGKIKVDDIVLFTRQFATMFRVGVPLLKSLHILKDQVENKQLKFALNMIAKDIEEGCKLTEAFRKHPRVFSPLYCNMLAAGEASGNISVVLENLCDSLTYESKVRNQVKGALQYPIIVSIVLTGAFAVLMGFVIPAFVPIFGELGGDIPAITRGMMKISNLFTGYWQYLIAGNLAIIIAFIMTYKSSAGRLMLSKITLRIPLIGRLIMHSYMARFGSLFAILQSSGILIVDTLNIITECIQSAAIRAEIAQASIEVATGKSISAALSSTHFFSHIMLSMISIGEASGNLEEMMKEASTHFTVEVEYSVKKLTGAIGPILVVVMAVAVGFFAMGIYLPIWEMTSIQMK